MDSTNISEYIVSITKEEVASLPTAIFSGEIKVVDNFPQAIEAIEELKHSAIIGFDTETRPAFKKYCVHDVALVQLSTFDKCWLFRINKIGLIDELVSILEDPGIVKIGISVHDDFHNLNRQKGLRAQSFIELQRLVKQYDIADASLQRIYAILFGERISKNQRLTNWEADTLTEAQCHYAALDAYACLRIYEHLHSGAFDPNESNYRRCREIENHDCNTIDSKLIV